MIKNTPETAKRQARGSSLVAAFHENSGELADLAVLLVGSAYGTQPLSLAEFHNRAEMVLGELCTDIDRIPYGKEEETRGESAHSRFHHKMDHYLRSARTYGYLAPTGSPMVLTEAGEARFNELLEMLFAGTFQHGHAVYMDAQLIRDTIKQNLIQHGNMSTIKALTMPAKELHWRQAERTLTIYMHAGAGPLNIVTVPEPKIMQYA